MSTDYPDHRVIAWVRSSAMTVQKNTFPGSVIPRRRKKFRFSAYPLPNHWISCISYQSELARRFAIVVG